MGQITTGMRAILSHPKIYNFFQNIMGARGVRHNLAMNFMRARPGERVLDIGCGTAEILSYLPQVKYFGFDISPQYIDAARSRYGDKGHFFCEELTPALLESLPKFDLVIAIGLLHHLDDSHAIALLHMSQGALRPGGRLISFDPVFDREQNSVARFIVSRDRGQNIRSAADYQELATKVFSNVQWVVQHRTWIPYTHCIMACTK